MRYRKRPLEIEAVQWKGVITDLPTHWYNEQIRIWMHPEKRIYFMTTLKGDEPLTDNCYIIRGVKGEFYTCDEEIFLMTYDKVLDVKET